MKTPAELSALEAAAELWEGTPFCANSAALGAGVCCHRLCGAVYSAAGWTPPLALPEGAPAAHGAAMERWLDGPVGSALFRRVDVATREPGDLIGFRLCGNIRHLGILLTGGRFVHSTIGTGARIAPNIPPAFAKRIAAVWRPISK
jgi:cell wall-associated NlpC family hydrolase